MSRIFPFFYVITVAFLITTHFYSSFAHEHGDHHHSTVHHKKVGKQQHEHLFQFYGDHSPLAQVASINFGNEDDQDDNNNNNNTIIFLTQLQGIPPPYAPEHNEKFHSWYQVPSSISVEKYGGDLSAFLADHSDIQKDLVAANLAAFEYSSTTPHGAEPHIHCAAFKDPSTSLFYLHLFLDPRAERINDGHHHDYVYEKATGKNSKKNKKAKAGSSHRQHHHDKIHFWKSSAERFWFPASTFLANQSFFILLNSNATKNKNNNGLNENNVFEIKLQQENQQPQTRKRKASSQSTTTTSSQPELITFSEVGPPESVMNFVFLSAGYLASQRDMFVKNVSDIVRMMVDPEMDPTSVQDKSDGAHDIHRSNPFSRYWKFFNIYAVYEPSVQQGASRPLINLVVDNNLKCVHPAEIERAVSCDRALSLALAAISPAPVHADPARVVIVSMVNTAIYGGSAIYIPGKMRFASFFNGFYLENAQDFDRMLSLVTHETGHALGNLMDEYSVGVSEPSLRFIANCQPVQSDGAPTGSQIQWSGWLDAQATAGGQSSFVLQSGNGLRSSAALAQWGVLSDPQPICGYTNYYKPNSNCMMNRLTDYFMCPICREASTLSLMSQYFQIFWPKFPFTDQVLVVYQLALARTMFPNSQILNTSSTVVLHLNRVLTIRNGFAVTAYDNDGTALAVTSTSLCPACIILSPSQLAKYPVNKEVKIRVSVKDSTSGFLLEKSKTTALAPQLTQTTYFRLVIVDSSLQNELPSQQAPPANTSSYSYFFNYSNLDDMQSSNYRFGVDMSDLVPRVVLCLHNNITFEDRATETGLQKNLSFCRVNVTKQGTYTAPDATAGLDESFAFWVPIGGAILGVSFLVLWVWACNNYTEKSDGKIRVIFTTELSWFLKIVRYIMLGASVIILLASLAAVALSVYVYYNAAVVGKFLVVLGVVFSVLLYLIAFLGFWAVMSRSTKMLILNAFALAVPLGLLIYILIMFQILGTELKISNGWAADLTGGGGNSDAVTSQGTSTTTTTTTTTQVPSFTLSTANSTLAPDATQAPKDESSVFKSLEKFWLWLVANYPDWACSFEQLLQCSGWYTSCSGSLGSTAMCPTGCDATNQKYFSPCQSEAKRYIVANYGKAMLAVALCVIILGLALLLNLLNLFLLWRQKKKLEEERAVRIKKVEAEMAKRRAMMGKTQNKIAQAANDNKALFLLRSLETATRRMLIREIKRAAMNKGGSFNMTKAELFEFFKDALSYTPTKKEIEEIFELAKTTKEGVLSIKEFLIVFGWSIKEFKAVPTPPRGKSALQRVASMTKSKAQKEKEAQEELQKAKSISLAKKNSTRTLPRQDTEKEGNANGARRNSQPTIIINDLEPEMEISEGEDSDEEGDGDDELQTAQEIEELRKSRHEMRRKSAALLGGDLMQVGTPQGDAMSPGVTDSLSPAGGELNVISFDESNEKKSKSIPQYDSDFDECDVLGPKNGGKEFGNTHNNNNSNSNNQKTSSTLPAPIFVPTSSSLSPNNNNNNYYNNNYNNNNNNSNNNFDSRKNYEHESNNKQSNRDDGNRYSASNYTTNSHSLFAVPPPSNREKQMTVQEKEYDFLRNPPRIFDLPGANQQSSSLQRRASISNQNNNNTNSGNSPPLFDLVHENDGFLAAGAKNANPLGMSHSDTLGSSHRRSSMRGRVSGERSPNASVVTKQKSASKYQEDYDFL